MMFGSAESERPTVTNREIIFEEFQPITYVTLQMDGQATCHRIGTALCIAWHGETQHTSVTMTP